MVKKVVSYQKMYIRRMKFFFIAGKTPDFARTFEQGSMLLQ